MANTEAGAAYVSIYPSMKGFTSRVSQGVKSAFAAAGTIAAAGTAVIGAAVGYVGKSAFDAYANYEQLVDGVETLFKGSAGKVQEYAASAYKTSGVSANKYMEQVTSFAASLTQSLKGDTDKAAAYGNMAIRDMADNASKMGTNISSIQDAYQGFAKQNYTMLDNLKLGFGGTKSEAERLIATANEVKVANGEMASLSIDSFADMVEAIHIVQEQMGITGTAGQEAMTTIQGSISMAKSAWDNWLSGLGNDSADMGALTDQLVESMATAAQNIAPRIVVIGQAIVENLPTVFNMIGQSIGELAPGVWESVKTAFNDLTGFDLQPLADAVLNIKDRLTELADAYTNSELPNLVSNIAGGVGTTIVFILNAIGQALGFISSNISWLAPIAGIIGAVIAALVVVPPIIGAVSTAITAIQTVIAAAGMIKSVQGLGAVISTVVGGPIPIAIAACAAVAAGLVYLWNTNETFRAGVTAIWETLSAAVGAIVGTIVNFFTVTIPEGINSMVTFFSQLPTNIGNILGNVITNVVTFVSNFIANAISGGARFVSGIIGYIQWLPQNILNYLRAIISGVVGFVKNLGENASRAGRGFLNGISEGFNSAVNFVSGIPGRITGALGYVGDLLWNAGDSIIQGFLSGIKSAFETVKTFVGGIATWIQDHKGPISYDKKLLIANGQAIMQSLSTGLRDEFQGSVIPLVGGMAQQMVGAFGTPVLDMGVSHAMAPQSYSTDAQGGITINISELAVREEADINKIAQRLKVLTEREKRLS